MLNQRSFLFGALVAMLLFGACTPQADHARFIPKDALTVTALNTKALSKKVAWSVITGSKLFKQMQEQMPDKHAMNFDSTGIDVINTFYVYVKGNSRLGDNKITGLVPLANVAKWETFVKKTFPASLVRAQGTRKITMLGNGMYAGWNNNLLIVMNVLQSGQSYTDSNGVPAYTPASDSIVDIEMENAFSVTKENALTGNPRFAKLLADNHDISFWLNYDQLMTQYMSEGISKMMSGVTLSNVLWKDAALAAGLDFEKGKITGELRYYVSDDMKDAAKELGGTNADKDMLDRLPKQNLDMVVSTHLSPKGLKAMLDKTGMLGLANLALSAQGMNTDYVLDAFTGDMALTVTDLDVKKEQVDAAHMETTGSFNGYKPSVNALYVFKINKKDNFNKLLQLSMNGNMLRIDDNTFAIPLGIKDSIIIMTSANYAVVTNKRTTAISYIEGKYKGQRNEASAKIYGHPSGVYMDIQEMLKWLKPGITEKQADNRKIEVAKNLLDDMLVTGGDFHNGSFDYHMDLKFKNKDENSLLTLLDFGIKMQQADSTSAAK